jgi:hypothetical protein
MNYIVYNLCTGKIERTGYCPPNAFELQAISENESVLEGQANDLLDWIENGAVTAKLISPTTINGYILTNLPIPSTVRIGSEEFLVEDGELDMTFDLPGTYTINVDSFPFQDATFEVTVI